MYNPNFHGLYAPAIGAGTVGIGGQISYPVVCQFLANGGIREFDAESRVPFANHKRTWISYDDEQSLEEKVISIAFIPSKYSLLYLQNETLFVVVGKVDKE